MAKELTMENAKAAFLDVLAKIRIDVEGAGGWDLLSEKKILVITPLEFHDILPNRLLQSVKSVCQNEPYSWDVVERDPEINDDTTLQSLFDDWFTRILS